MLIHCHPHEAEVTSLLTACGLPISDLEPEHFQHFLGYRSEDELVGVVGIQVLGHIGLLRSLAVAENARKNGLGKRLVTEAETYAKSLGLSALYLLTNTAESFFAPLGYSLGERGKAPEAIRTTPEFSRLCPASSAFMLKQLGAAILQEDDQATDSGQSRQSTSSGNAMKTIELSTCFCTNDVNTCREFYQRYFSAEVIFDCGWYVNLRIGGDGPSIQFMQPQDGAPVFDGKGVTLNFKVDDVDAVHAKLTEAGLQTIMPLEDHPWGDRGFSTIDPLGSSLYIYSDREPSDEFKQFYKIL